MNRDLTKGRKRGLAEERCGSLSVNLGWKRGLAKGRYVALLSVKVNRKDDFCIGC